MSRSTAKQKEQADAKLASGNTAPKAKYPGLPQRISERFLETWVPEMDERQARELRDVLLAKGWAYRLGSMQNRFYARLQPDVRKVLQAERQRALKDEKTARR